MVGTTCLALDGSLVTFGGELELAAPASVMELLVRRDGTERTVELVSGSRENARWAATEVAGVELTESFAVHGGELHVGRGSTEGADGSVAPLLFGVWEGAEHSIGVPYHWSADPAELLALFEACELSEDDTGVSLRPRGGDVQLTDIPQPPSVAVRADDLGVIEAYPVTRQSVKLVPAWEGTRSDGGELFRGGSAGSEFFLLACPSAIATVAPQPGVDLDAVAGAITSLTVTWQPPGDA